MKTQIILSVVVIITMTCTAAMAEPLTAAKGLEKIKTNLDAAKNNRDEYDRNLNTVNINMNEIKKSKDAIQRQKSAINSELAKNSESVAKIATQEKEINNLIAKEREKLTQEQKQMDQLQSLMDQIKKNQEIRNQVLADYQTQLAVAQARKAEWKERENQLKQQEAKTTESLRGIASDESNWIGKKQKFEKEKGRWTAEAQKHQKIHDSYQGLSEGK